MGGARFLLALSVSDSITIVSLATYSVLELLHKYCSAYIFVYLGDSFYCLSSYITIAVVAQRYISIAFPFSVSRLCSNVRTRVTLILLVATAALQNVGYAKFTTTRYLFCVDTNRTQEEVAAMQADEVDMVYVYFALNFLPLLPLVLFNSLLLRALWKMKQIACADANRSYERAKLKVSVMAVCVSSTTILTYCASQTVNFYVIMNYDLTTASLTASYDEHVANALGFVRERSVNGLLSRDMPPGDIGLAFLPLLALVVCIVFLVRALRRTKETKQIPMLAALAVKKDFAVVFAVSVNVFFYSFFSENFRTQ
nr:hypothetical protein BaRGS_033886 [Batillaria attramentaria]